MTFCNENECIEQKIMINVSNQMKHESNVVNLNTNLIIRYSKRITPNKIERKKSINEPTALSNQPLCALYKYLTRLKESGA